MSENSYSDEEIPELSPSEIPDFRSRHIKQGHLRTEEMLNDMAEFLDDLINKGQRRSPYNNDDYHMVSTRHSIPFHAYQDSPTLPHPDTKGDNGAGAHVISISLNGTRVEGTGFGSDEAKPKHERARAVWNCITVFGEVTDAEIKTEWSSSPRDSFQMYLFYDF